MAVFPSDRYHVTQWSKGGPSDCARSLRVRMLHVLPVRLSTLNVTGVKNLHVCTVFALTVSSAIGREAQTHADWLLSHLTGPHFCICKINSFAVMPRLTLNLTIVPPL